jgi:hypothetical protein
MGVSVPVGNQGGTQDGVLSSIPNQVVTGAATATNTTSPQTIITVPAGRTWVGSITLGATNSATAASNATAKVNTSGTGAIPAAAVNLLTVHCSLVGTTPAGLASQNNATPGDVVVQAPVGNSVTLTLTNSTATTFVSDATAVGVLV